MPLNKSTLYENLQKVQQKATSSATSVDTAGFSTAASTAAKQLDNYKTRLEQSNIQDTATDSRNWFEKWANLPENQWGILDALELLGRPQQALFGGIQAGIEGRDVLQGAKEGFAGTDRTSGGEVLRAAFAGSRAEGKWNEDWTHWAGTVMDMALDPADWLLIPLTGGMSAVGEAAVDSLKLADEAEAVLKGASKFAKLAGEKGDDAARIASKLLDADKYGIRAVLADLKDAKIYDALPRELKKQIGVFTKSFKDYQKPLTGGSEFLNKNLDDMAVGIKEALATHFDDAKKYGQDLLDAKAKRALATSLQTDGGKFSYWIGYYANKENRTSLTNIVFGVPFKGTKAVAKFGDNIVSKVLSSIDDSNLSKIGKEALEAGTSVEEAIKGYKKLSIAYKDSKRVIKETLTRSGQGIDAILRKGKLGEAIFAEEASRLKKSVSDIFEKYAKDKGIAPEAMKDIEAKIYNIIDFGDTAMERNASWRDIINEARTLGSVNGMPASFLVYSDELWSTLQELTAGSRGIKLEDLAQVITSKLDNQKLIAFNYDLLMDKTKLNQLFEMAGDRADDLLTIPRFLNEDLKKYIAEIKSDPELMDVAKKIVQEMDAAKRTFADLSGVQANDIARWSMENDWRISHIMNPEVAKNLSKTTTKRLSYVFGGAAGVVKDRKYNYAALETNYLIKTVYANFTQAFPEKAAKWTDEQRKLLFKYNTTDMFAYDVSNAFNALVDKQLKSLYQSKVLSELMVHAVAGDIPNAGGVLVRALNKSENVPNSMQLLSTFQKAQLVSKLKKINEIEKLDSMRDLIKKFSDKNVIIDKRLYAMINRVDNKKAKTIWDMYDKFNTFYKSMKVLNPSFNLVNIVGNAFNMWASGMSVKNIYMYWGKASIVFGDMQNIIKQVAEQGVQTLSKEQSDIYKISMEFFQEGILDRQAVLSGSKLNETYTKLLMDMADSSEGMKQYGISLKALARDTDSTINGDAMRAADQRAKQQLAMQRKNNAYRNAVDYNKQINTVITDKEYNATERATKLYDYIKGNLKGVSFDSATAYRLGKLDPTLIEEISNAKNADEVVAMIRNPKYAGVIDDELKKVVADLDKISEMKRVAAATESAYKVNGVDVKDYPSIVSNLMNSKSYAMAYSFNGKTYNTFDDLVRGLKGVVAEDGVDLGRKAEIINGTLKSGMEKQVKDIRFKDIPQGKVDQFKVMVKANLEKYGVNIVPASKYVEDVDTFLDLSRQNKWPEAIDFLSKSMPDRFVTNELTKIPDPRIIMKRVDGIRARATLMNEINKMTEMSYNGVQLTNKKALEIIKDAPRGTSRRELSDYIAGKLGWTKEVDAMDAMKTIDGVSYSKEAVTHQANSIIAKHNVRKLDNVTEMQRMQTTILSGKDTAKMTPTQVIKSELDTTSYLTATTIKNGGGTFSPDSLKEIDYKNAGGYQVSIRDLVMSGDDSFPAVADLKLSQDFIDNNDVKTIQKEINNLFKNPENAQVYDSFKNAFKKAKVNAINPDESIGTWISDGKIFVDNSITVADREVAVQIGDSLEQLAITSNASIAKKDFDNAFISLKANENLDDITKNVYSEEDYADIVYKKTMEKEAGLVNDKAVYEDLSTTNAEALNKMDPQLKEAILSNDPNRLLEAVSKLTGKTKESIDKVIRFNMYMNSIVDQHSRMALYMFAKDNPTYLKQLGVNTPMEAVKLALFDPSDVSYFEKDVMKRLIPFYTFTKKNIMFQAENMARNSKKYNQTYKLLRGAWGQISPDVANLPEYQYNQGYIPIPIVDENGKYSYIKANIPFYDYVEFMNNPLDKFLSSTTPWLRTPFELAMNKSVYTGQPIADYAEEPGKLFNWVTGGKIGLPKMAEYAVGQFGLDSPLKVLEKVTSTGAGIFDMVTGKTPMGTAGDVAFGVGEMFNIAKQGDTVANRQSRMYADLEEMKTLMEKLKDYNIPVQTIAEGENSNKVLENLKKRLSSLDK